jgi:hypothetical protein
MDKGMDTDTPTHPVGGEIIVVGDFERAIAGSHDTCFSGRGGTSITGDHGHSVAGDEGYAITGANGNASSGLRGISSAGVGGAVRAGLGGVISLDGRDGDREFTIVLSINPESGPQPGVYYRLRGHVLVPVPMSESVADVAVS